MSFVQGLHQLSLNLIGTIRHGPHDARRTCAGIVLVPVSTAMSKMLRKSVCSPLDAVRKFYFCVVMYNGPSHEFVHARDSLQVPEVVPQAQLGGGNDIGVHLRHPIQRWWIRKELQTEQGDGLYNLK